MPGRIKTMKANEIGALVLCQLMRMSRTQAEVDGAAIARTEATKRVGIARVDLGRHAAQVERDLQSRYAELRTSVVGLQHLLSVRDYEQAAAQEKVAHLDHLALSEHRATAAVQQEIVAKQQHVACARRMAKLEEIVGIAAKLQGRASRKRLEQISEDVIPTRPIRR